MKKCNPSDDDGPCLERGVINGCVCPNGTIINEENNTCVAPSECPPPGTYIAMYTCSW